MPAPRRRLSRVALAAGVLASAAGLALFAVGAALAVTDYEVSVPLAPAIALVQALAIPLALVRPRLAASIAVLSLLAFAAISAPTPNAPWPVAASSTVALCIVLFLVATLVPWPVAASALGVAVVGVMIVAATRDPGPVGPGAVLANLVVFAAVSALVLGGGVLARSWRDARRLLAHEREISATQVARRELVEERTRIARELHDIVAHGMSAIQVQAASARYRIAELSESAASEFDEIAETARAAMGEMRLLLGVLRDDDAAEHAPQPGLAELPALLERAAHAGPLTVTDRLGRLRADPLAELAVYRVVQESLSNVARHAPGSAATVVLDRDRRGALLVEVCNEPPVEGARPSRDRGGHGLRGMRERLDLLHGDLDAGPTPEGGFAVRVRIPASSTARPADADPRETL